jgi:hypothetical protein
MSALGQKRTLKRLQPMSALPPKADIAQRDCHVRFVPKADIALQSITSSARASKDWGTDKPSAFAVFKLMASSYLLAGRQVSRP